MFSSLVIDSSAERLNKSFEANSAIGAFSPLKDTFYESFIEGLYATSREFADYTGLNNSELKEFKKNRFASDELQKNQVPGLKDMDITQGRSNSSANTTSHSALSSSEAMS